MTLLTKATAGFSVPLGHFRVEAALFTMTPSSWAPGQVDTGTSGLSSGVACPEPLLTTLKSQPDSSPGENFCNLRHCAGLGRGQLGPGEEAAGAWRGGSWAWGGAAQSERQTGGQAEHPAGWRGGWGTLRELESLAVSIPELGRRRKGSL